jgi:hypothetical protein
MEPYRSGFVGVAEVFGEGGGKVAGNCEAEGGEGGEVVFEGGVEGGRVGVGGGLGGERGECRSGGLVV